MITSTKYCCAKVIYIWSVYADGSICLDILQNQWSPIYDVAAILTSIQVRELFRFSMGGFFFFFSTLIASVLCTLAFPVFTKTVKNF